MKYVIVLALLLSSISPLVAQQMESDLDGVVNQEVTLVSSFSNFMSNLLALLCEKTAQAKIVLHNLIHSIVEMSQLLTSGKKSMLDSEHDQNLFNAIDEQMFAKLSDIAIMQAHTMSMIKGRPTNAELNTKHKADVQKILNFFTGIMQSFFTIVQSPEDKQNVAQGLIGMLGNIIAAGNTIIKDSQQTNAPGATIAQVVDAMDENTKQQVLNLIQSQGKCIRIQMEATAQ